MQKFFKIRNKHLKKKFSNKKLAEIKAFQIGLYLMKQGKTISSSAIIHSQILLLRYLNAKI